MIGEMSRDIKLGERYEIIRCESGWAYRVHLSDGVTPVVFGVSATFWGAERDVERIQKEWKL